MVLFRCKEQEAEIKKIKTEYEQLRLQVMPIRGKSSPRNSEDTSAVPMTSSVAKVVQPTATVSSVPVSGPSMSTAVLNCDLCLFLSVFFFQRLELHIRLRLDKL